MFLNVSPKGNIYFCKKCFSERNYNDFPSDVLTSEMKSRAAEIYVSL